MTQKISSRIILAAAEKLGDTKDLRLLIGIGSPLGGLARITDESLIAIVAERRFFEPKSYATNWRLVNGVYRAGEALQVANLPNQEPAGIFLINSATKSQISGVYTDELRARSAEVKLRVLGVNKKTLDGLSKDLNKVSAMYSYLQAIEHFEIEG